MSSRLLAQTLRTAIRSSTFKTQITKTIIPRVSVAKFSTSLNVNNQAKTQLNEVLAQELKYEEADAFGLDETFKTYLEENKIEIINTDGKVLAELVKTVNETEKVHIYFDVLRISQTSMQLKQMQEQLEQSEYLEDEVSELAHVDVNVVVAKDNKATGFDVSLSLIDSSFSVTAITNFEDAQIALSDSPEAAAQRDLKYSGPEFSNLAEELQEAVNQYLVSRGVDQGLAEFILAYSGVKENNEYLDWLENFKKFTN